MFHWLKQTLKKHPQESPGAIEARTAQTTSDAELAQDLRTQGNQALAAGNNAAAEVHFRAALALQPENADTLTCLGFALKEQGQWEEAMVCLEQAIAHASSPGAKSECHVLLAQISEATNEPAKAEASYLSALELQPALAQVGIALFDHYRKQDHESKAVALLLRCVNRAGNTMEYRRKLAAYYIEKKQFVLALQQLDIAQVIDPKDPWVYFLTGMCQHGLQHFSEAIKSFSKAIALDPGFSASYINRGSIHMLQSAFDAADADFQRAIALQPHEGMAYGNLGELRRLQQRFHEALALFDKAIELESLDAAAYWNKSLACLAMGDLEQGWKLYEYRWRSHSHGSSETFTQTRWTGAESLVGKTILLHAEQGLGDTLQFCRYALLVSGLGARVILEVQGPLLKLLSGLSSDVTVIAAGAQRPHFDFHCPLMSLPLAFGTTLDSIPCEGAYIKADPEKSGVWKARLRPHANSKLVGLVWSGGFRKDQPELWGVNGRRNIPLEQIAKLNLPHLVFLSLQKGDPAEAEVRAQQDTLWPGNNFINWAADLNDFSDTAALIDNLDLVIAVDTSTAHLAAAMGKPVWLLNRFDSCWRWLVAEKSSRWYPSLSIYRQTKISDWSTVIEKVREDLLEEMKVHTQRD